MLKQGNMFLCVSVNITKVTAIVPLFAAATAYYLKVDVPLPGLAFIYPLQSTVFWIKSFLAP